MDFTLEVNPILSRVGCNQGTCHGSQKGQNGFKLSLRGYDPLYDYRALVDDISGRRFNRSQPAQSLMLLKPTQGVPHEGGFLFDEESRYYRIVQWYPDGGSQVSGVVKVGTADSEPVDAVLLGTSPNPFNNTTIASFEVRKQQDIQVSVWSVGGNLVDVLADRVFDEGVHQVRFTGDDLPSGIYFLMLRTAEDVQTVKMTLMK